MDNSAPTNGFAVASLVVSTLVAAGSLIWNAVINSRLESQKADLLRKIESQKADWALSAKLAEIRFSKLHERQVEALQAVFTLLANMHDEFFSVFKRFRLANEKTDDEKRADARKAVLELQAFLRKDGILLPPSLTDRIEKVNNAILNAWLAIPLKDADPEIFWDAGDKYLAEVPDLLQQIHRECRKLLGVIQ